MSRGNWEIDVSFGRRAREQYQPGRKKREWKKAPTQLIGRNALSPHIRCSCPIKPAVNNISVLIVRYGWAYRLSSDSDRFFVALMRVRGARAQVSVSAIIKMTLTWPETFVCIKNEHQAPSSIRKKDGKNLTFVPWKEQATFCYVQNVAAFSKTRAHLNHAIHVRTLGISTGVNNQTVIELKEMMFMHPPLKLGLLRTKRGYHVYTTRSQ